MKKKLSPIFLLSILSALGLTSCDGTSIIAYEGEKCVPDCKDGELCCAGICIDALNDSKNCGTCWNRCRNTESCVEGKCRDASHPTSTCDPQCTGPNESCCDAVCIDTANDPNHCGACGIRCDEGVACKAGTCQIEIPCDCPEGMICNDTGQCVVKCGNDLCKQGEQCCNDACTTLDTIENCGACGTKCSGDSPYCQYGGCANECKPQSCDTLNFECGTANDGCGNTIDCGSCGENKICASNHCVDACTPTSCQDANKNCGFIDDGCGNTLLCGECGDNQICTNNVCIDIPSCIPTTCEAEKVACGAIDDGCTGTLQCGSCPSGQICKNNACVDEEIPCSPVSCAAKGKNCGSIDDGCGNTLNCGACSGSQICVGNVCAEPPCTPTTCATKGKNCGSISDGCGKTLNCGACSSSQECKDNVCKAPDCTPTTCAAKGKNCGSISDGCGKTLNCGACSSSQECKDNVCVDKPTSIKDTYPKRQSIKGLQPDFQSRQQVYGNATHGVAMNMVWYEWQPAQSTSCTAGQYQYDGYCFTIHQRYIDAIKDYSDHGVVVTAVVYGVPNWARRGCESIGHVTDVSFCAPVDGKAKDYGRFAGFLANFFNGEKGNGRIADFVIHNEVNSTEWFNVGCANRASCPLDTWTRVYADSYNAAYDYVKKEQKNAKVLISFDHFLGQSVGNSYRVDQFLKNLVPKLGTRDWLLAFHSYPPDLTKAAFGADDYNNNGIVSFGNIGVLAGWLRQNYPSDPHAWEIMLTENGINGTNASMQNQQASLLCQAFRNVLGTPGVTSFIYHRLVDHPTEVAAGLGCGLWNANGSQKPAWTTFALANRSGVQSGYPSCGFELLPYTKLMRGYGKGMHWVTSRQFPSGVTTERSWKILREEQSNTQMVYECRVGGANGSHTMISTYANCENQFNMGPMGYVYKSQVSGTQPIYRCIIKSNGDHFISPDPACEGQSKESLIGYAYPL